jgi:hypothetical protein
MKKLAILLLLLCSALHAEHLSPSPHPQVAVQKLNFAFQFTLTDTDIQNIVQKYPHLTELSLAFCKNITDSSLEALAEHCPFLDTLDLEGCTKITDAGLIHLISRRPHLKKLDLASLDKVGDNVLKALAEHCPSFEALAARENQFSDAGIQLLAEKCRALKEVDLLISPHFQYSLVITADSIKTLSTSSPNLKTLRLRIQSSEPWPFELTFPELQCLELFGTTDHNLTLLAKGSPNLEKIALSMCDEISDNSLEALAACPKISAFTLEECNNITPFGLHTFLEHHSQLKRAVLNDCPQVSDLTLATMEAFCPHLEKLGLENTRITDEGILALAPKLHHLKNLSLAGCSITNVALKALTRRCPLLETLNLSMCKSITDIGVNSLLETSPELKELHLSGCFRVMSSSVHALATCCPKVEMANLFMIGPLTEGYVQTLVERCPNLQTVHLSPTDWYRFTDSGFIEFLSKTYPNVKISSPL